MKTISFQIIICLLTSMACTAQAVTSENGLNGGGNFSQYLFRARSKIADGSAAGRAVTAFNNEENTIGKRFLFDAWVKGDSVLDNQQNYVSTASYLFNLDMMTSNLLATEDKVNIMAVAPSGIRAFILNDQGHKYFFERVGPIDSTVFCQVMVKNSGKESLYKRMSVKYVKANFRNDGVIQTGNAFNEYKDQSQFYLVNGTTGAVRNLGLKPKSVRAALESARERTDNYFRQHKDAVINEEFLTGLVYYVNE